MAKWAFYISSRWRLDASPDEAWDLISRPEDFPRWWPAAFTDSLTIQSGDETGAQKVVRLESRGFLPLLLRWHLAATQLERPRRLLNRVWGDFEGTETWTLAPVGGGVTVTHEWRIEFRSLLLRVLSTLLRPFFVANHRWAMRQGEQSLRLEIARRRAVDDAARGRIRPPPAGVSRTTWGLAAAAGAVLALAGVVRGYAKRR
jgi:hypothetical protein